MSNIIKDVLMKEDIELDNSPASELGNYQKEKVIDDKVSMLNQDPTISIISNNIHSEEELIYLNKKYSLLPKKFKALSNQYSIRLFGYNVPNMFSMMRDKLITNDYIFGKEDKVMESHEEMRNRIKAMTESTDNIEESEDVEIKEGYYDFSDYSVVPWFTLDEEYCKLEFFEDPEYTKKLVEAVRKYKYQPTLENCTAVLDLGWNPSVDLTRESVEYAKKRQIEYLKEHTSFIYDLTKTDINAIQESSRSMRSIYKELNIYPIYIVLSWTNTNFGKLIRFVKNSKYTHAGMCLDSDLNEILTFKYDSITTGFEIENLKSYINTYRDCQIEVLCLFVDKDILNKLNKSIEYYKNAKDVTKYGFKNLFNILLNKKKEFTEFDTEMVCSQFVDHILKLCDIDITGKANNLVIPQDYATIASTNPKVYKIYEGYGKDYTDSKIETTIKDLLDRNGSKIRYKEESYNLEEDIDIPVEYAIYTIKQ